METNNTDENISNKLTSSEKENINILKAILSTGNIGIWHMDIKANLIYLDDTMFEIFGIKKTDHFKYEDWKEYIHPEDLKAVEKALQKIIEDKNINTIEFRIIQPKGDIKYIQCPLSVVSDNYNQPLRITGACTDITQKKMLEEEIKYLSNLPEDNPNPMICVNPDFKIIYTNNASKPLIELIQTDDIMSINNEWRSIIDNLKDYSGYKTEVICGGRIYLVSITKNKKTGFINICGNDITERKEKELVIQQNNNALAESNKKLNELYKQLSEANEELVKSQNIITKSERSFKLLIENMPLGVSTFKIIKDDQGTPIDFIYLSINKSYEKISMLKADEIRGKSFLKIISDIESQWIELFKKVALTGKNEVYERFNKIWNKHISVTIYTPENDIIVCFVEDISQKKLEEIKIINQKNELEKANEKLRNINEELIKTQKLKERSELSYKLLVENMPWGIATFKMNTDNEENPYDFIFISVNK
ncbi:MAG: PAS domain S-box protein, partial [Bacteroidota bacterium]|nr:PAS domain S-box protein [Bacteroidota bacterium]